MSESLDLNVVILPDENTKRNAIELSRQISSQFKTYFTLDGVDTHPHITLYQSRFPKKNYDKLVEWVRGYAGKNPRFDIAVDGMTYCHDYGVDGFIFWNCKSDPSNELPYVHRTVMEALNPLREGLTPLSLRLLDSRRLQPEEARNIREYGYLTAGKLYKPHITITRIASKIDRSFRRHLYLEQQSRSRFTAERISIGHLGEHGTVTGILDEFPLQ